MGGRVAFGRVGGRGVVVAGGRGGRGPGLELEMELELAMGLEVEVNAEAEGEVEVEEEIEVGEFGSESGGPRRGCEPPSNVAEAADNEMKAAEVPRGSATAGSCGAAGCHLDLLFSSQPRCSLRLLRVMRPAPNSRSRRGLPTSGPRNSSRFRAVEDKQFGRRAWLKQRVWWSGESPVRRARRVLPKTRRQVLSCGVGKLSCKGLLLGRQGSRAPASWRENTEIRYITNWWVTIRTRTEKHLDLLT